MKAAIKQPNCVIVTKSNKDMDFLKREYYKLLSNSTIFKKFYWKLFGRKHPKFMTIDSRFEGLRLPRIFDNGSF